MKQIILASQSRHRAELLRNAGITFETCAAEIDEREIEKPLLDAGLGGPDVAEVLAISKATDVSNKFIDAYVIGCDQTLSFEGQLLHKPENMEAARRRLLSLSGKSHELNSAVSIVRNGETLWTYVEISTITFRKLDPGFVGRHLAEAGDGILSSVGAYQIEGLGVQLFEKIDGDFFSIIGLPVLPLLAKMRELELVEE
ncbi:MAG: Maf-like protein [Pseudomonadota bacterium]